MANLRGYFTLPLMEGGYASMLHSKEKRTCFAIVFGLALLPSPLAAGLATAIALPPMLPEVGLYEGEPAQADGDDLVFTPRLFVTKQGAALVVDADFEVMFSDDLVRGEAPVRSDGSFRGVTSGAPILSFSGTTSGDGNEITLNWSLENGAELAPQIIPRAAGDVRLGDYRPDPISAGNESPAPLGASGAPFTLYPRVDVQLAEGGGYVGTVSYYDLTAGVIYRSGWIPIHNGVFNGRADGDRFQHNYLAFVAGWDDEGTLNLVQDYHAGGGNLTGSYDLAEAYPSEPARGRFLQDVSMGVIGDEKRYLIGLTVWPINGGLRAEASVRDDEGLAEYRSPVVVVDEGGFFSGSVGLKNGSVGFRGIVPSIGQPATMVWFAGNDPRRYKTLELRAVGWHYCMEATGSFSDPAVRFAPDVSLYLIPTVGGHIPFAGVDYRDASGVWYASPEIAVTVNESGWPSFSGTAVSQGAGEIEFVGVIDSDGIATLFQQRWSGRPGELMRQSRGRARKYLGAASPGLYTGPGLDGVRKDARVKPFVWIHGDPVDEKRLVATATFVYSDLPTSGQRYGSQQLGASKTTPLIAGQSFWDPLYGDPTSGEEVSGCVSSEGVDVRASIWNGGYQEDGIDFIETFLLPETSSSQPAAAGEYPLSRIVDYTLDEPDLSDIYHPTLEVQGSDGHSTVQLRYSTPHGSFASEPVAMTTAPSSTFRGVAASEEPGRTDRIHFDGIFARIEDSTDDGTRGNFPILSQSYESGDGSSPTSLGDATGKASVVWLVETGEISEVRTADYNTIADAVATLEMLAGKADVSAADWDRWTYTTASAKPNDPGFRIAPVWRLGICCTNRIGSYGALEADAWDANDGADINIAVVDSGVVHDHPDLDHARVAPPITFYKPPVHVRETRPDPVGHGTKVASLIASTRNNSLGIAGAAASAAIRPVSLTDGTGRFQESFLARALEWMLAPSSIGGSPVPIHVANLSLAGLPGAPEANKVLSRLISLAIEDGIVLVAAAGNCARSTGEAIDCDEQVVVSGLASRPGVISVGAADIGLGPQSRIVPARYARFGKNLDLIAPGGTLLDPLYVLAPDLKKDQPSGIPYTTTAFGTSMATPFVTATVAMILAQRPELRRQPGETCDHLRGGKDCVAMVTALLQQTALSVAVADVGYNNRGILALPFLQARGALDEAEPSPLTPPGYLTVLGCDGADQCGSQGVLLMWDQPTDMTLNPEGYIVYVDGQPMYRGPRRNALPTVGLGEEYFFSPIETDDTTRTVKPAEITYTVSTLYKESGGFYRESMYANVVSVRCNASGCVPERQ